MLRRHVLFKIFGRSEDEVCSGALVAFFVLKVESEIIFLQATCFANRMCDSFKFWHASRMEFATVSGFGMFREWNLLQFQVLECFTNGICYSFRFWNAPRMEFASVSGFEMLREWNLRQF